MGNNSKINELLEDAKKCRNKGRLYVYEQYKRRLLNMGLTTTEYEQTCRQLAEYLRV